MNPFLRHAFLGQNCAHCIQDFTVFILLYILLIAALNFIYYVQRFVTVQ